ncbi:DUF4065 domain-containing protein [Deferribacter autotrophicus]|uniref:DUF4065 domain-containing protein n=1 Tax=Deferribacter autotrophicus TaxID=500465 RepID=A0A5A8F248_9BACT|nr:type II toxin-antitoxin system antitoxin SocA domain-containing protein [Deferribacter autotrophicus]KAA0257495.1 DUF4065 domain-containing protein [Deferribacter autotrophicus]
MMNASINVKELIRVITNYITKQKNTPLTKTKLIKLLYLLDVEYYRLTGKKLTDFNWIYYKFGPYAYEFENLLTESGVIIKETNDVYFINSLDDYDANIEKFFDKNNIDIKSQIILKRILDQFSSYDLNKLLDFVYYETEPMENVNFKDKLDFGKIDRKKTVYRKPQYTKSNPDKIKLLREKFDKIRKNKKDTLLKIFLQNSKIAPVYDDLYYKNVKIMEQEDEL